MPHHRVKIIAVTLLAAVAVFGSIWLLVAHGFIAMISDLAANRRNIPMATSSLIYAFNTDGVLNESEQNMTTSPYWWLNSGGELIIENGIGKTIQGGLMPLHRWRLAYAFSSASDTDNGYHPQNLFRLVSRSKWKNPRVQMSFRIVKDNLSSSQNRNESNGVLIMSRYVDGDDLYYAGVRVDGTAVIKKKEKGIYHTLAQTPVFPGNYNRDSSPDLLPHSEWITLMSETETHPDGAVDIRLYVSRRDDEPRMVLTYIDPPDAKPITATPKPIGIRTDFMDVEFGPISLEEL